MRRQAASTSGLVGDRTRHVPSTSGGSVPSLLWSSPQPSSSLVAPPPAGDNIADLGRDERNGQRVTSSSALVGGGDNRSQMNILRSSSSGGNHHRPTKTAPTVATEASNPPLSLADCKAALACLSSAVAAAEKRERRAAKVAQKCATVNALLDERLRIRQRLVKFNVGGQQFMIPQSNLKFAEGSFFDVIQRSDFELDRDEDGCIFLDRDPETFRIIMNYIRGYKVIPYLNMALAHKLLSDAHFYQIDTLAEEMQQYIFATTPSSAHQFTAPGAGINVDRTRLRAVYNVSPIGDRLLLSGRHSITILIAKAEYVGLGVISDECTVFDSEFHRAKNCCVYYMTGITYTNFPHHKKEESSEKFGAGDTVTIVLDMQNKVVEYRVRNTVRCYSCATASRLRFAAVIKFDSEISIVDSTTEMPTDFLIRGGE